MAARYSVCPPIATAGVRQAAAVLSMVNPAMVKALALVELALGG